MTAKGLWILAIVLILAIGAAVWIARPPKTQPYSTPEVQQAPASREAASMPSGSTSAAPTQLPAAAEVPALPPAAVPLSGAPALTEAEAEELLTANFTPEMRQMCDRFGVVVLDVTAHGDLLDARFSVSDAAKAEPVIAPEAPRHLYAANGTELPVPTGPRGKLLRKTTGLGPKGQGYIATFYNPGGLVKRGDKVSLVLGECRASDLIVK